MCWEEPNVPSQRAEGTGDRKSGSSPRIFHRYHILFLRPTRGLVRETSSSSFFGKPTCIRLPPHHSHLTISGVTQTLQYHSLALCSVESHRVQCMNVRGAIYTSFPPEISLKKLGYSIDTSFNETHPLFDL